jgi:hypothetical protein
MHAREHVDAESDQLGAIMPTSAFNLAQVLWDERKALEGAPLPSAQRTNTRIIELNREFAQLGEGDLEEIYRILNSDDRWALCLSGGGIRSAAFALGIAQCFARHHVVSKNSPNLTEPLLQQFDYLSTVSGGGYLGSWLSAWLFQERRRNGTGQAAAVLRHLNERVGDHDEVEQINNLRRNTHYLAPSFSALSPDVWSDIAAMIRNLLLNWVLLVPPVILLILATKGLAFGFSDASTDSISVGWVDVCAIGSVFSLIFSLAFAAANRPTRHLINSSQAQFLALDLLTFVLAAVLLIFVLATPIGRSEAAEAGSWVASWVINFENLDAGYVPYIVGATLGCAVYLVSWFAAYLWKLILGNDQPPAPEYQPWHTALENDQRSAPKYRPWHTALDLGGWCLAGGAFGALVAAGVQLLKWFFRIEPEIALLLGVMAGIPSILFARTVADVIFVALTEIIPRSEGNLEYRARADGLYTLVQIGWIFWFGFVLFGSWLAHQFSLWIAAALASAGGISGAVSLIIGISSKTPPLVQSAKTARKYLNLNTMAAIAAAIFAAVLIVSLSIAGTKFCHSGRAESRNSRGTQRGKASELQPRCCSACVLRRPRSSTSTGIRFMGFTAIV